MSLSASAPWLRHYGTAPAHLDYPDRSMYGLLAETARQYPGHIAYDFLGKKTTYSQFMQRIDAAARGLTALGIQKGDAVTICMPNSPQAVDCFYALNRIGAIANVIHPLSAATEIAFYLNISGSKAILTLDQFYKKIADTLPQVKQPCTVVVARIAEELPFPQNLLYPMTKGGRKGRGLPKQGYIFWRDLICRDAQLPPHCTAADDHAVTLYSGGTSGTPKGIMLSSRNFNALGLQTIAASGFGSVVGMKMLSVMPIFHGFGLGIGIHTALIGGASCILIPQFNMKTYTRTLLRQKPNIIPGVPTLFEALLRSEDLNGKDLSFLKGIFCGGDSLSIQLKKKVDAFLKEHGCAEQIREGYGTTECVNASCLTPKDHARTGSIGIPLPDMYYKIVKPGTADEVEAGTEGEICVSGPTVMLGYLNNPEETATALRRHGDGKVWLHTGDLGMMDGEGFVYFRQRIKRMIVTSGYNVYPAQLENIIDGHEKVLLSCVIGVKDAYRGQRIRAYVVPMPGVVPTEELKQEILHYCARHIARYAMPREFVWRRELPKTAVGKVAYRVLEEEAMQEENQ